MSQCAFCSRDAKLSGEHIWADWICELFPDQRVIFRKWVVGDTSIREWEAQSMDLKTKVVCKPCNEGWMSDLESKHAEPTTKSMILRDAAVALSTEHLTSIAISAFKTAVIGDHMQRNKLPFFSAQDRHTFASTLRTPFGFHVWIGCISAIDRNHGVFRRRYWNTPPERADGFKLYMSTWGIGRFITQTIAVRPNNDETLFHVGQSEKWNSFAIPVWPMLAEPIVAEWPPPLYLGDDLLDEFCDRAETLRFGKIVF